MSKRILVCGGRDYGDGAHLAAELDKLDFEILICGMAAGADYLAYRYALAHNIPVAKFPADWKTWGKRAGFIRNQQMLIEGKPQLVVAFAGGKGTAMMCDIATKAGVEVIRV